MEGRPGGAKEPPLTGNGSLPPTPKPLVLRRRGDCSGSGTGGRRLCFLSVMMLLGLGARIRSVGSGVSGDVGAALADRCIRFALLSVVFAGGGLLHLRRLFSGLCEHRASRQ